MLIKGMQCRIVPVFITGDLVALPIKLGESSDQKIVVICSAYFPQTLGCHLPLKVQGMSRVLCREKTRTPRGV